MAHLQNISSLIICRRMLVVSLVTVVFVQSASAQKIAVITHESVKVDKLDSHVLLDIYTLEEVAWKNGDDIILVEVKGKTDWKSSFYSFLGSSSREIKKVRLRSILAGEGTPPLIFATAEEALEKIKSTPGAVGCIPLDVVQESKVKVVNVIPQ